MQSCGEWTDGWWNGNEIVQRKNELLGRKTKNLDDRCRVAHVFWEINPVCLVLMYTGLVVKYISM